MSTTVPEADLRAEKQRNKFKMSYHDEP